MDPSQRGTPPPSLSTSHRIAHISPILNARVVTKTTQEQITTVTTVTTNSVNSGNAPSPGNRRLNPAAIGTSDLLPTVSSNSIPSARPEPKGQQQPPTNASASSINREVTTERGENKEHAQFNKKEQQQSLAAEAPEVDSPAGTKCIREMKNKYNYQALSSGEGDMTKGVDGKRQQQQHHQQQQQQQHQQQQHQQQQQVNKQRKPNRKPKNKLLGVVDELSTDGVVEMPESVAPAAAVKVDQTPATSTMEDVSKVKNNEVQNGSADDGDGQKQNGAAISGKETSETHESSPQSVSSGHENGTKANSPKNKGPGKTASTGLCASLSMASLFAKKKNIAWLKAYKSAKGDRKLNQVTNSSDLEDVIINLLAEEDRVSITKFWNVITSAGIKDGDPRLRESRSEIAKMSKAKIGPMVDHEVLLDKDTFKRCISENIWVIGKAFKKDLIVPEFRGFTEEIEKIFQRCMENEEGEISDSVPAMIRQDRDVWGVSLCTIDGQRADFGDSDVRFGLVSCTTPFNYALAVTELGGSYVHDWVGFEPSGRSGNDLSLNHDRKPFNPLVNSGAIVILSMLRAGLRSAERFDHLFKCYKKLAGREYIGFNNALYLCEKDNSDRNHAIVYNLRENGCTPGTTLLDTLDFHFQMESVEVTPESAAVMAATLANGGLCPLTGQRVLTADAVRDTLSLMNCCGMSDYSGHFAFTVGLPAKSDEGGCILLVIPDVMGICCYSPLVDNHGNSVKGLQFCEELVQVFCFHNYDTIQGSKMKIDPRMREQETPVMSIMKLMYGASIGDIPTIRRFVLAGMDMATPNYDGRTALHVAAAAGHLHVVKLLIEKCCVNYDIRDRYGKTALDDAKRFGQTKVIDYFINRFYRPIRGSPSTNAHDITRGNTGGLGISNEE